MLDAGHSLYGPQGLVTAGSGCRALRPRGPLRPCGPPRPHGRPRLSGPTVHSRAHCRAFCPGLGTFIAAKNPAMCAAMYGRQNRRWRAVHFPSQCTPGSVFSSAAHFRVHCARYCTSVPAKGLAMYAATYGGAGRRTAGTCRAVPSCEKPPGGCPFLVGQHRSAPPLIAGRYHPAHARPSHGSLRYSSCAPTLAATPRPSNWRTSVRASDPSPP